MVQVLVECALEHELISERYLLFKNQFPSDFQSSHTVITKFFVALKRLNLQTTNGILGTDFSIPSSMSGCSYDLVPLLVMQILLQWHAHLFL